MNTIFTLDWKGIAAAAALGILLLVLGGPNGPLFFLAMLFFLVVSAMVTRFRISKKAALGVYEHTRGWRNVAANGVVPLFIAFLLFLGSSLYQFSNTAVFVVAFLASVAAITADKFSSEIGVLDKRVFMLIGHERVRPGVSGGVSRLGLAAGLVGSALFGVVGFFSLGAFGVAAAIIIVVSGVAGDIIDSLFGYFEDRGVGTKFTTNVACAGFAALIALALFLLVNLPYLM